MKSGATEATGSAYITHAAGRGSCNIVKLYLEHRVELSRWKDNHENTALIVAAFQGHLDVVQLLLATDPTGVSVRGGLGTTALHEAIHGKHVNIVEILLQHGADITALDDSGRIPLMIAASICDAQIGRMLLDQEKSLDVVIVKKGDV